MATMVRELLTADQMSIAIYCGGFSQVGWGIAGTWAGTATFEELCTDNPNVWILDAQTPFPSGTASSTVTANATVFSQVKPNILAKRVRFSRTSGSMQVIGAGANDASFQDAYLTSTTIFNSNRQSGGGLNTIVQAAQPNSAWNLTSCEVCTQGSQTQGQGTIAIYDGTATGSILWQEFIPSGAGGSVGFTYQLLLPKDDQGNQTLVNTIGNAMTIILSGYPLASTIINCKFKRA